MLTTSEVATLAGVPYRVLDYAVRRHGLFHPVRSGKGSGHSRQWPELEARIACRI